jgi:hypothetical protein
MSKVFRNRLGFTLIWFVALFAGEPSLSKSIVILPKARLTVRVFNQAQVEARVLLRAVKVLIELYRRAALKQNGCQIPLG